MNSDAVSLEDLLVPFVPEEELRIHSQIHAVLQEIVSLKSSNHKYSLDRLTECQTQLEMLSQQLVEVRQEFKRTANNNHVKVDNGTTLLNSLSGNQSTEILSRELNSIVDQMNPGPVNVGNGKVQNIIRLRASIPAILSSISSPTRLTPTDLLLKQALELIDQLVNPLLKHVSPILFPIYSQLDSIHTQLMQFKKSGAYLVQTDIVPLQMSLRDIENSHVVDGKFVFDSLKYQAGRDAVPEGQAIISARLHSCYRIAHILIGQTENLAPSLAPIYAKLVKTHRKLLQLNSLANTTTFSLDDVLNIQKQLRKIDSLRHNHGDAAPGGPGSFLELDQSIPAGQAIVISLLESCFDLTHSLLSARDPVIGALRNTYETLIAFKHRLNEIFESRLFWSIQGTSDKVHHEVFSIQRQLKKIDGARVDGKFVATIQDGHATREIDEGQAVLHFMLHKCYRLIYKIIVHISLNYPKQQTNSDGIPGSPNAFYGLHIAKSLLPVYRQLITIRRCLFELKKHAPWYEQDLTPWKAKLLSMGVNRTDGLFLPACKCMCPGMSSLTDYAGQTPREHINLKLDGHDVVGALWDECFELLCEMEVSTGRYDHDQGQDVDQDQTEDDDDDADDDEDSDNNMETYKPLPITSFIRSL